MAVRRLMKTLIIQMAIVSDVEELPEWLVASFWHVHTLMMSMAVRRSVLWCGACAGCSKRGVRSAKRGVHCCGGAQGGGVGLAIREHSPWSELGSVSRLHSQGSWCLGVDAPWAVELCETWAPGGLR